MTTEIRKLNWNWNLFVDVDNQGAVTATLAEDGKIDYSVEIHKEQMPWLNALRELLRKEGHLLYRPGKEAE